MAEAMRHAYVDRNSALGDPDFVKNPVERLLSEEHAAEIRAKIDPNRAGVSADLKPAGMGESHETTHYSIVDSQGNAVAVTYTLNGSFGARVVAPGTGVLLNNEMDDFTQKPGVPNLYGLVQGAANAIEPGKSPLSSMSPTVVSKDGEPLMVIGSPGGSRIITITLEAILNVIEHGMDIQQAIDARRASITSGSPTASPSSRMRCRPTRSRSSPPRDTRSPRTRTGRSGARPPAS